MAAGSLGSSRNRTRWRSSTDGPGSSGELVFCDRCPRRPPARSYDARCWGSRTIGFMDRPSHGRSVADPSRDAIRFPVTTWASSSWQQRGVPPGDLSSGVHDHAVIVLHDLARTTSERAEGGGDPLDTWRRGRRPLRGSLTSPTSFATNRSATVGLPIARRARGIIVHSDSAAGTAGAGAGRTSSSCSPSRGVDVALAAAEAGLASCAPAGANGMRTSGRAGDMNPPSSWTRSRPRPPSFPTMCTWRSWVAGSRATT